MDSNVTGETLPTTSVFDFNSVVFGLPKTGRPKAEKVDPFNGEAGITMVALPLDSTRLGRKFTLNKKACDMLGYDLEATGIMNISYHISADEVVLGNSTGLNLPPEAMVTFYKAGTFSSRGFYDFLVERFNLDQTVENHLTVTAKTTREGQPKAVVISPLVVIDEAVKAESVAEEAAVLIGNNTMASVID